MKKILALILAVVSVFCFASCSLGTPKSKEGEKIVKYFNENAAEVNELKELYVPSQKMIKTGDDTYLTVTSGEGTTYKAKKYMKYIITLYRYVKVENVRYIESKSGAEYTTTLFLRVSSAFQFYGSKASDINPNFNNGKDSLGTVLDGMDVKCNYKLG